MDGKYSTFGPLTLQMNKYSIHTYIYPNPSSNGEASIQISGLKVGNKTTLQVLNREGKIIFSDSIMNEQTISNYELSSNISLLPGIYFVKVNSGMKHNVEKLIVQ